MLTFTRAPAVPRVHAVPMLVAGVVGAVLAAAYLLAQPMGADLSAQLAHAELAEQHWPALLDLRWYSGYHPLGYSVLSPPLTALIGVRLATALGYLAGVMIFAALLTRTAVRRPTVGAVVGALCFTGNLASTRTPFMLGLAAGLAAMLALVHRRLVLAGILAVVAALTSPVAGLFLGVAGAALVLSGSRRRGAALALCALTPTVAVGLVFGNGGRMSFGADHAAMALIVCLVVAAVCWRESVVRWGALLSAAMVAAAYLVPTPVGSNAARLPELFAPAVIVAVSVLPGAAVAAVAAAVVWFLPPLFLDEIRDRGQPALDAAYYAPLLDQLNDRQVTGPVEVVPMRRHGEAAAVAPEVAIARGWLRQVDLGRNPFFYDGPLDADTYRDWLDDNAVAWVAVARGRHDWAANEEAELVRGGLSYLRPVWSDPVWTLYAVANPRPVVSAPGRVLERGDISLTVQLPEPGLYEVRIRWSRFVSASTGCVRESADGWTIVGLTRPGTVTIEGSLFPRRC
jgi:hypothetical protein